MSNCMGTKYCGCCSILSAASTVHRLFQSDSVWCIYVQGWLNREMCTPARTALPLVTQNLGLNPYPHTNADINPELLFKSSVYIHKYWHITFCTLFDKPSGKLPWLWHTLVLKTLPLVACSSTLLVTPTLSHPSPNQEPTNSERKLVFGDLHPSANTDHPTLFLFWELIFHLNVISIFNRAYVKKTNDIKSLNRVRLNMDGASSMLIHVEYTDICILLTSIIRCKQLWKYVRISNGPGVVRRVKTDPPNNRLGWIAWNTIASIFWLAMYTNSCDYIMTLPRG